MCLIFGGTKFGYVVSEPFIDRNRDHLHRILESEQLYVTMVTAWIQNLKFMYRGRINLSEFAKTTWLETVQQHDDVLVYFAGRDTEL